MELPAQLPPGASTPRKTGPDTGPKSGAEREAILRQRAQEMEVSFLSEMLSYTGLNETSDFSGGTGEDQFSSFLREEQAKAMVQHGGIGLAETIFKALVKRDDSGE